ncbi:hypothetical protein HI914_06139 [Erysiphe necator]|nr:hypothetical protein HI914_06139 [Erysiphe necator]
MTSLISLHLMNKKGVHWNSMAPLQMIQSDGSFFCKLFQFGRHWTFERIPVDIKTSQTNICNSKSAFTGGSINKIARHKKFDKLQLHRIFGHSSPEVIDHTADAAREGTITVLETKTSPKSIKCETCALSKAHQKISKISDKEHPQTKPFERITLDLIPLREGFNSNTQIIHFQCAKTLFNMIFTMYTKSESLKYTRKTLKMIKSIGHQLTYIHLDGESTLEKGLDDLAIEEGIQQEVIQANKWPSLIQDQSIELEEDRIDELETLIPTHPQVHISDYNKNPLQLETYDDEFNLPGVFPDETQTYTSPQKSTR